MRQGPRKITRLGHSAFRVETSKCIIPFLTGAPNFTAHFRASRRNAAHIPPTHAHDDHIGDTLWTGAEIVANLYLCVWLEGQGPQKINPGDAGDKISPPRRSPAVIARSEAIQGPRATPGLLR